MTQTTNTSFYSQVLTYRSAPILPDYHSASILPFHTGSSQEYLLYSWIMKIFYLNSTARLCGGIYSCAVDVYSFIQK